MLRRSSSQKYVCWRHLSLGPAEPTTSAVSPRRPPGAAASRTLARHGARSDFRQLRCASTDSLSPNSRTPDPADDLTLDWLHQPKTLRAGSEPSNIRERLRQWEAANPGLALSMPSDHPAAGSVANNMAGNRSEFAFKPEAVTQDDDTARPLFDGDGVIDLSSSGSMLHAGDLVEVSSGVSKAHMLAVCLGTFNGHLHFYTSTGKWFTSRSVRSGFVVRNFVDDPAELRAVIDVIPSFSPSSAVLNELQDLNIGPSRDLAASLIRKLYTFQNASRIVHQTYVERLSRAHVQFGEEERILSLREIADVLLPASLKRNRATFPPEALYAVYSVIRESDIAFRALDRGPRCQESYLFALQSVNVQENIAAVEQRLREYSEYAAGQSKPASRKSAAKPESLEKFLSIARQLIDQTRRYRSWSPHGMIGPYSESSSVFNGPHADQDIYTQQPLTPQRQQYLQNLKWSSSCISIIKFMEYWAASGGFSTGSRCHWIGASILRALGRYEDAVLDSTTGWTFLQEIGWIPPWDVRARHALRLPGLKRQRHPANKPTFEDPPVSPELGPDKLAHLRQDFDRSATYCIDSADTSTSTMVSSLRIKQDDEIAQQAAAPGANQLSSWLLPTAHVTETGHLLDTKITPGKLSKIVYITPEDVSAVVGDADPSAVPTDVFEVGSPSSKRTPPARKMATPKDLSAAQTRELKTLSKLANALQRVRLDNGAIPAYLPRPKATVLMNEDLGESAASAGQVFYRTDPYIRVGYGGQGSPLVSSLMQLAGEIGARWCYERDIPIPYRVQRLPDQTADALRAFNRDVIFPQLLAGKSPSADEWHTVRSLMGDFDISTTPAPNLAMGLDMYAKVTSPLRRYADLLAHWQIEAALLEENSRGQSLVVRESPGSDTKTDAPSATGPTKSNNKNKPTTRRRDFLPFSKGDLENDVFPRLRIRERHAKLLDNVDGNSQWILQALVRAWHFGDASTPLPEAFRFTVSDVSNRRAVGGQIDWFDRPASVELEDMNGVARIADVKPGDVFKVELASVNVHTNKINVKLLEKLEN
ncbi:hypothetical protein NEMBOFW57_002412 [Staphylotrichum longicolle]|uniref:RNB domain-containing protein n=1 Tax=Staphylotrichum longicolle TaxID=669026 RepID=A0AAD4F3A5_9PEZI|nr:hypothetical protein NEMBOFW57_002412 [Staphylotrichum longicolle]